MPKISQFYQIILLIVLSIGLFFILKPHLPARLFSERIVDEKGMLIDSVLLEVLNKRIVKNEIQTISDSIALDDKLGSISIHRGDSLFLISPEDISATGTTTETGRLALRVKAFVKSNFLRKLEKRKPKLFIPNEYTKLVIERPIIDTLLDPTVSIQGYGYLQRFYSKLNKLENGGSEKARVAYFGDSMNDGDLIVQDFRSLLQDDFGGNGVGFVSITSMSAASRGSVQHKFSENWYTQSFVSVKSPSYPFGVDGQVFTAVDSTAYWVSYSAGNVSNSPALYNPTLFYGAAKNKKGSVNVEVNKGKITSRELTPEYALNTLSLGASNAQSVNLNFQNIKDIPIYGLNFSSYTGVHVDNFSLRGNSGLPLSGLNIPLMNAFDRVLNYDLVILHYGTNVLNYGSLDYSFYEKRMTDVINKLRFCFPRADILVISTADKSSKIDTKMTTDPAVISLVRAQKNFARDSGTGFIDLYSLMGGSGSMVEWVKGNMANKDYTHFNVPGSKKIGSLLYDELQRGYKKYKIQLEREKMKISLD